MQEFCFTKRDKWKGMENWPNYVGFRGLDRRLFVWDVATFFPLNGLKSRINFCSESCTNIYEILTK